TPADKDVTSVQVFVGTSGSNVVVDTTTAKLNTPNPATPAVSPGQTKTRTGTTLTFTHSVTNTGEVDGIFSVTGPSGSGLPTFVGTAPTGWSIASATLASSTVAAGASTTLTIVVNTPAGAAAGSVQFSFIVKASTGATTSPATVDTITVPVVRSFGFSAVAPTTKSSPPGISVSFTYASTNTGNAIDTFLITPPTSTTPAGITSFTANPSTSFSLAAGASRTVTVSGTIPSSTSVGSYSFTVSAQGVGGTSPPAAKTASGTITVTGGGAPLFVGSASVTPNPVTAGNQVTIVHTVRNNGNQSSDFSFGATLPSGWTLVSQANTCATPVPADSSTCTVTTIVTVPASANGGSYSLTVSATATNSSGTSDDVTVSNVATVNVAITRAVSLSVASPAAIQSGIPGTVLTYTHTLVNTGNATDSFTISVTPTAPATVAMAIVSPTSLDNVARNGSKTITLVVTIPNGVSTGDLTFTVTATSKNDASATASQVDTATVEEYDGASISAGTSKNGLPGTTITFTHTLTNTGSTTIAYDITAANSDTNFAAPVITSGSTTAVLSPGTTATVVIQITLPSTLLGGTANTTTIEVTKAGTSAPILASATNQSRVGKAYDVQITPDRSGTGYPNSSLVFTHTVTNIGITADTYTITGTNSLSWVMSVSPRSFTLAPGSSQEVSVLIDVPNDDRTLVGADNFGRVRVVSDTNPDDAYDEAVENIEIGQSASLIFTASQARAVTPSSGTIRMHDLVLNNTGNGSDIFDFTVLGADDGWEVNITSFDILGPRDTDYNIGVTVTVPDDVEPGPTKLITIRAKSRHDPTVYADVYLRFVYISAAVDATYGVYLPVIAR
ncbi:MAG: hypothetical protein HGA19_14320, partial [Oscillochloris sp.]|nr:hypothetical protein [Oscillochloris sp.]